MIPYYHQLILTYYKLAYLACLLLFEIIYP